MAEVVIANIIQQLGELALEEAKTLRGVEGQCTSLMKELKMIKNFLKDAEEKASDNATVRELLDQIREVSFDAEDIVETFLLDTQKYKRTTKIRRAIHAPKRWMVLRNVAEAIENVNRRIDKIHDDKGKYQIEISREGSSTDSTSFGNLLRRRRMKVEDEVVGFMDVTNVLLARLVEGSSQLQVVSIVGMGGLGKTSVARKLYNDPIVRTHFSCFAWVFVSEVYDIREVILGMLKSIGQNTAPYEGLDIDELKEKLSICLQAQKFIVFLDDVWKRETWDDVKECFKDGSNGSRIVITSRITEVARYSSVNEPHFLRFLDEEESWSLFIKKVFRGDSCPDNLEHLGRKIATRCNGLPLSIVVLGDMLATKDKSERVWEGTLKHASSFLNQDKICMDVLALSYCHLPTVLKPCFLYFGAFPEDYKMPVQRLILLWLVEGFIHPIGDMSLEDVAERYIEELVDSSLIQVGTRRSDGGIKTCHIHDLLRDLCIREAKRENFFVNSHTELLEPPSISLTVSSPLRSKHRRISTHRQTTQIIQPKGNYEPSTIRALLSFEFDKQAVLPPSTWKFLCNEFKLLKILDLGFNVSGEGVPDAICKLMNLRYLRIRIPDNDIPSSIFKLWNLQILIIHGNLTYSIPKGLFKQQRLQQLIIHGSSTFPHSRVLPSNQPLVNLYVLSSVFPNETFKSLVTDGYFPNLIKLGLFNSPKNPLRSLLYLFSCLPRLEKLKMSYVDSIPSQCVFEGITKERNLAPNLKKLTIKTSTWSTATISMLGKFPNLQILKLRYIQNKSDRENTRLKGLNFSEEYSFPKLHTLHLESINVDYFEVDEIALLQLRNLFVAHGELSPFLSCDRLWTLPYLKDLNFVRALTNTRREYCLSKLEELNALSKFRILAPHARPHS